MAREPIAAPGPEETRRSLADFYVTADGGAIFYVN